MNAPFQFTEDTAIEVPLSVTVRVDENGDYEVDSYRIPGRSGLATEAVLNAAGGEERRALDAYIAECVKTHLADQRRGNGPEED